MRDKFNEQLSLLNNKIIEMGAMCEEIIALVTKALYDNDDVHSIKIEALENEINHKEREIEGLCLRLLLRQQPVAKDLRQVSAALKIITDMERIGDHATDINEMSKFLIHEGEAYSYIRSMAKCAIDMVTKSVDAFIKEDIKLADEAIKKDDEADGYFSDIKSVLIEKIANQPECGETALDFLMTAKYFERICDHAVNIAEWVVFYVEGTHKGE